MAKQKKHQPISAWVNTPIVPQAEIIPPVIKEVKTYIVHYLDEITGEKKKTPPFTDIVVAKTLQIMRGGTIRDAKGRLVKGTS